MHTASERRTAPRLTPPGLGGLHWPQVLENTSDNADSRPDSAALSRPYSVKVSGWQMGHRASLAAPRCRSFQHLPSHPAPLENGKGGSSMLTTEPETMTTPPKAGRSAAASVQTPAHVPTHYLKRLAHRLASRAALRRAELRARAYGVIAADRLNRGGAA